MPARKAYKNKYKEFAITGRYEALVVDVYDGDTITVVFDPFPNSQYSGEYWFKIRLMGIDTPEMKPPKSQQNREYVKTIAKKAGSLLRDRILNKVIMVDIVGTGKYGRSLGYIYFLEDDSSINDWLVNTGFARAYGGDTKYDWGAEIDESLLQMCN